MLDAAGWPSLPYTLLESGEWLGSDFRKGHALRRCKVMQRTSHKQKLTSSRRTFLKSAGALATGLSLGGAALGSSKKETLAINGGPKAITSPTAATAARWPQYGQAEQEA